MARRKTDAAAVSAAVVVVAIAIVDVVHVLLLACEMCVRVYMLLFLFRSSNCRSVCYCYVCAFSIYTRFQAI